VPTPRAPLTIRDAVPQDAEAVHRLSVEAILGSTLAHYDAAQASAWAARRTLEGHQRMIEVTKMFLAVSLGGIAGFASLALAEVDDLQRGEVDQLFVRPEHGGTGVATALLDTVDFAARADGVTRLITHASWRAAPVFERHGFQRVEVETVNVGQQVLTRVRMTKDLTSGPD
jgi:putative acetyltransferase